MAVNPYSVQTAGRVTSGSTNTNVSEREDLANFISMITRDETPFMSSIGKTKATAVFHEWQTDELADPVNSSLTDGSDYTEVAPQFAGTLSVPNTVAGNSDAASTAIPSRTRLGNFSQINGKTVAVSGTKRAVDQAGVADEYAYQLKKRGTELRRDLERHLIHTNQATTGSGTRLFGGFSSFINSGAASTASADGAAPDGSMGQTVKYKSGWTSPASTGVGSASPRLLTDTAPANGTFELDDIDEVMQAVYEAGGKATKVMVSPKNRRVFSAKAQASSGGLIQGGGSTNVRRNLDEKGSLRQSVDMYMSDFGEIMIMPNYIMGLNSSVNIGNAADGNTESVNLKDTVALVYDSMWFNIATLRPLAEVDVGQRGDSTVGMIVEECTLEVRNPIGCGAIYGLNGS